MTKDINCLCVQVAEILIPYKNDKKALITILQKVQEKIGYISEEAVSQIAESLEISEGEIFGVATFYAQFRFNPPGEHNIKVCLGTACHVRGAARILDAIQEELGIKPGETTPDKKFDLERVACFGCCAWGPVVVKDDKVYGKMTANTPRKMITGV
jgi:NADH:ubiquinone oxidoreductase subunit E